MKIALVIGLFDRNAEHFVEQIAFCEEVDDVFVIRDTPAKAIPKVHYITPIRKFPKVFRALIKFILLLRVSWREDIDYIHSFLLFPHGYIGLLCGILTHKKTGVSFIAGPIELFNLEVCNVIGKYPYLPYNKSISKKKRIFFLKYYLINKFSILTTTGDYTKSVLERYGISNSKIYVLPHTVDDRFKPIGCTKIYDLIVVGRLARVKHLSTFIRALALIKDELPSVHAVIVGDGECIQSLRQLAQSLSLGEETLHFAGYQMNVWEWYNRSRISIISSEREGFPYTAIESLKCGVPVITSNCGDICDIVKDRYNGCVIQEYDDVEGFAQAIVELLQNEDELKRMTENAVPSVASVNHEHVCEIWDNILRKVND